MSPARAYRSRPRPATDTRGQIVAAVGELLEEGTFHESTVEEVAERAGVARATLYQHFGSRLGLVDAICETVGQTEELRAVKAAAELEDPADAVRGVIAGSVRFWAAHERRLEPLYRVAAVDEAAARLVERQQRDRKRVLAQLAKRHSLSLPRLLVLTSFETYLELRRHAGLSEREVVRTLQDWAATP
jgi:AcrR family transcriptional regulator